MIDTKKTIIYGLLLLLFISPFSVYAQKVNEFENTIEAIRNEINKGNDVRIFVFCEVIIKANLWSEDQILAEQKIRQQTLTSGCEKKILDVFRNSKRFSLLDRSKLDVIMKEYELQLSGVFDQSKLIELGKEIGATYVLARDVSFIFPNNDSVYIDGSVKLIDITTSKILSIDVKKASLANDIVSWEFNGKKADEGSDGEFYYR